ncbi:MAG: hypothetical protein HKN50_09470 [Gammaproteobacteria bacterium]|nr:hypothetical protein [Gammaproteobacteria bacterium]
MRVALATVAAILFFVSVQLALAEDIRLAPGDNKDNYESADYHTDSLALPQRIGAPADLLSFATRKQTGLPAPQHPANNQPDAQKIALGRKLFFDRRLSRNGTMSCAMCHIPEQGFASNELARSIGFEGRSLKRNAPTILNVGFYQRLFQDAREFTLEQQVWSPLLATNEMNNASIGQVIKIIQSAEDYTGLFERAFKQAPNMQNIGMALAQYERSLVAADSAFDQWLYGGDKSALTDQQIDGYELFIGKAGCVNCHLIGTQTALFTDQRLHSTGLGFQTSLGDSDSPITVQLAPGVFTSMEKARVESVGEKKPNDLGRYEVTLNPADRWKFRTPSLRNVALTAPYMHDGSLPTLASVVKFYKQGGVEHELLSPLIKPLNLDNDEQSALVAFMQSLTGDNVSTLVADAFAANNDRAHNNNKAAINRTAE